MKIGMQLNGANVDVDVATDEPLLAALRREGVRGCRPVCGIGICGACTALIDGETHATCLVLAPLAADREVTTVEGLPDDDPVVVAVHEAVAYQCGYCTPGIVMAIAALLAETADPTDAQVTEALAGNLCRCGCYVRIRRAALDAGAAARAGGRA